ncbi:MAG: class IV adenylate cyclase [Chitinophagaceae bacterium]
MEKINFEFKAKVENLAEIESRLKQLHPKYIGEDVQTDTYFHVPNGRLKLRVGNIENALIHYDRQNIQGSKQSTIQIYQYNKEDSLKNVLLAALGIKAIVDKRRRIYFIDNVKFHFDTLANLGTFLEVEAIDNDGSIGVEKLQQQCAYYQDYLGITEQMMASQSYSDMMMPV